MDLFNEWLRRQSHREDEMGELARKVTRDDNWPQSIDSPEDVERHAAKHSDIYSPEDLALLCRVWNRWDKGDTARVQTKMRPDDYTPATKEEQRLQLIEDLQKHYMLDSQMREALEDREAAQEGWLRLIVWRYYEGISGLLDVTAELDAQMPDLTD